MGHIETAIAAHPLFCHQEFLEKLESYRNSPIGKRVSLLLQHLAIDPQRQHYKATRGENKGWRRSRLGGNHGSHFYAWWAPASAQPLRTGEGFRTAPEGAVVLRDIRHHDDHSLATPQELEAHYLSVNVNEIRGQDYGPTPWTQAQEKFAGARGRVRLLKGHPGRVRQRLCCMRRIWPVPKRLSMSPTRAIWRRLPVLTSTGFVRRRESFRFSPIRLSCVSSPGRMRK